MQPITNFNQNIIQNKCLAATIATISIALLILSTQNLGHPYFHGIGHIGSYICLGAGSGILLLMVAISCCKKPSNVTTAQVNRQPTEPAIKPKVHKVHVDEPEYGYYKLTDEQAIKVRYILVVGQIFLYQTVNYRRNGWLCEARGIQQSLSSHEGDRFETWVADIERAKNTVMNQRYGIPHEYVVKALNVSDEIPVLDHELTTEELETFQKLMHNHETFIYKTKEGKEVTILKSEDRRSVAQPYQPISFAFLQLRVENYNANRINYKDAIPLETLGVNFYE